VHLRPASEINALRRAACCLRQRGAMGDGIPGFVPKLLSDPTVGLFRADERIFDAMVDGWRAQMLARGLTTATIENRSRLVRRFQEFTGEFPWQWRPADSRSWPPLRFWPRRWATTHHDRAPCRRLGDRIQQICRSRPGRLTAATTCWQLINGLEGPSVTVAFDS
jgi:hypothetical protein